jgi:hypothetical protein
LLGLQADAYLDLGDVLEMNDRKKEAVSAWREALSRYETKGNLLSAATVRSRLGDEPRKAESSLPT